MQLASDGPLAAVASRTWGISATDGPPRPSADEAKLKKAAGDFESILLASLWKSMKQSFTATDDADSDPAHGTLDDWGIEVMAGAVGRAGGLGIGRMIVKQLGPKVAQESEGKA